MDSRGGCCIARSYGGGGAYDISNVDRIMMRFRPIAPKPASGSSVSPGSSPEMSEISPRSGRGKRRLNGRCNNASNNRRRKPMAEEKPDTAAVTLPLLLETPAPTKESAAEVVISPRETETRSSPVWLSFGRDGVDRAAAVAGSCVRVECVTDTWVDQDGLGSTDVERRMNLERDNCPGFVSDGYGRVTWTNEAYRRMVRDDGGEVAVWLTTRDAAAVAAALAGCRAFTCRVRVQNQKTNGREKSSVITLPCDVWRMDGGGFAWRLDVAAALSLGR